MNYDVNITSLEYRSLLFTALPGFYAPEEAYCLCLASIISKAAQTVDFLLNIGGWQYTTLVSHKGTSGSTW